MEKKTLISVNIHILFAFFIITIICGGSIIILLSYPSLKATCLLTLNCTIDSHP